MVRFSKADLHELSHRDDDGTVLFLEKHEVGDARMMFHYQSVLIANNLFSEDMENHRFTSLTRKDHISFSSHPDDIALLITTGDVTYTPPPNSGLDNKFKAYYSPAESFKKSIKRDESIFTNFK